MARRSKFVQPGETVTVVARSETGHSLSPELIEIGRQRVAAGESVESVALDLALLDNDLQPPPPEAEDTSRTLARHRLDPVMTRFAPKMRTAALTALRTGTRAVRKPQLRRALETGSVTGVQRAVAAVPAAVAKALRPIDTLMLSMLQAGGTVGADYLNGLTLRQRRAAAFRWNPKNPRLATLADEYAARLIENVSATTEQSIRQTIVAIFRDELDPDEAYQRILAAIGDEARAETIERTEVQTVVHAGQREAWSEAVEEGYLSQTARRVWIVSETPCPICADLEDATAPMDGLYPGKIDGPPAHPNCLCTEGLDV